MPLYTALFDEPLSELSTSRTAFVTFTPGFQPEMVPSSVAKMKIACLPGATKKSVGLPLKTTPVGADCVPGAKPGGGTMTKLLNGLLIPLPFESGWGSGKKFWGFPPPSYRVEVPELLLPIHQGLPFGFAGVGAARVRPQGLRKLGSTTAAP